MFSFAFVPQGFPVPELVLVREEVGPVLGLLEYSDETSVIVLESRIAGTEQLDADVDASPVEHLSFAVFAGNEVKNIRGR